MDAHHTGDLGEQLAVRYLQKRGFYVIDQNWRRKYGEIDIVAMKDGMLSFVEVKAMMCTADNVVFQRPEERVHSKKRLRLSRAVMSYLHAHDQSDSEWKFYVIAVYIQKENYEAHIALIEEVL